MGSGEGAAVGVNDGPIVGIKVGSRVTVTTVSEDVSTTRLVPVIAERTALTNALDFIVPATTISAKSSGLLIPLSFKDAVTLNFTVHV